MSKYTMKFTSQFKKDVKRSKKQNKDIDLLFEIIDKLSKRWICVYEMVISRQ